MQQALFIGLKREFWEYKRVMLGAPLLLSVLVFLAALMATIYADRIHDWAAQQEAEQTAPAVPTTSSSSEEEGDNETPDTAVSESGSDDSLEVNIELKDSPFEFIAIFISLGWFVGFYHLVSALYVDRRDNSILYWKSLPVSETRNVLTKLLFGSLGFVLVALCAAWVMYLLIEGLGLGSVESDTAKEASKGGLSLVELFVWPLHGIVGGLLWGAPVFGFLLMISSLAKRSRILLLIGPIVVIGFLEGIFFRSDRILGFFTSHMPHAALEMLGSAGGVAKFWQQLFGPNLASLLLGLLLACAFIYIAIWRRNDHFEI